MILRFKGGHHLRMDGEQIQEGETFGERGSGADYETTQADLENLSKRGDFEVMHSIELIEEDSTDA